LHFRQDIADLIDRKHDRQASFALDASKAIEPAHIDLKYVAI
jgi:hypothetical protein